MANRDGATWEERDAFWKARDEENNRRRWLEAPVNPYFSHSRPQPPVSYVHSTTSVDELKAEIAELKSQVKSLYTYREHLDELNQELVKVQIEQLEKINSLREDLNTASRLFAHLADQVNTMNARSSTVRATASDNELRIARLQHDALAGPYGSRITGYRD